MSRNYRGSFPGGLPLRAGAVPSADPDAPRSQTRDPNEAAIDIAELERSDRGLMADVKAGKPSGRRSTFHR